MARQFEHTGTLNKPPQILLMHMSQIEAKQMIEGDNTPFIVREVLERNPNMKQRFSPPVTIQIFYSIPRTAMSSFVSRKWLFYPAACLMS
jgi:hypothetical protein